MIVTFFCIRFFVGQYYERRCYLVLGDNFRAVYCIIQINQYCYLIFFYWFSYLYWNLIWAHCLDIICVYFVPSIVVVFHFGISSFYVCHLFDFFVKFVRSNQYVPLGLVFRHVFIIPFLFCLYYLFCFSCQHGVEYVHIFTFSVFLFG